MQVESKVETFFSQFFVVNQFAMTQVVQDGTEVGGISVNHVGPCLVLLQSTDKSKCVDMFLISARYFIMHVTMARSKSNF